MLEAPKILVHSVFANIRVAFRPAISSSSFTTVVLYETEINKACEDSQEKLMHHHNVFVRVVKFFLLPVDMCRYVHLISDVSSAISSITILLFKVSEHAIRFNCVMHRKGTP